HKAVQQVVLLPDSPLRDPYLLERKHRTISRGATGAELEIIISIMAGIGANIGTELIKALANKIRRPAIQEDVARFWALQYLHKATELDDHEFELLYAKEETQHFVYMFREKTTDKKHYIRVSKKLSIVEYRIYSPGIIPEEDG